MDAGGPGDPAGWGGGGGGRFRQEQADGGEEQDEREDVADPVEAGEQAEAGGDEEAAHDDGSGDSPEENLGLQGGGDAEDAEEEQEEEEVVDREGLLDGVAGEELGGGGGAIAPGEEDRQSKGGRDPEGGDDDGIALLAAGQCLGRGWVRAAAGEEQLGQQQQEQERVEADPLFVMRKPLEGEGHAGVYGIGDWGRRFSFRRRSRYGVGDGNEFGKTDFERFGKVKLRASGVIVGLAAMVLAIGSVKAQNDFGNWPAGTAPAEVGKALAEHFVTSPHQYKGTLHYSEVATWYGALTFAQTTHDDALRAELIKRFEPLMPGGTEANLRPLRHHVDDSIFGVVPLEISIQTKDAKFLAEGKWWADRQWENPQPDGLSAETRYWIDDMYMLTMLQLEAFRATGDKKYLDRDAKEMVAYLKQLQQPNGLFFHAPDVPYYWGRGDGWVAAGMAEMLRSLPADHPDRPAILAGYRKMMASLLKYQHLDGMWGQLIDHPESWPETSSSAMFSFAMITGVKNGWLDAASYGPAARKGWIGVVGYVDQNHDVTNVCVGTGKQNSLPYYLARPRNTGDYHGQAAVLWAATALMR